MKFTALGAQVALKRSRRRPGEARARIGANTLGLGADVGKEADVKAAVDPTIEHSAASTFW